MTISFRYFLITILLVIPFAGFTQTREGEWLLLQQLNADERIVSPGNFVGKDIPVDHSIMVLRQDGLDNNVLVWQSGSSNARIQQYGSANLISVLQHARGGRMDLEQNGNGNQYRGAVTGEEIELSLLQYGGYNQVRQEIWGRQMNIDVVQDGSHNEIQQQVEGSSMSIKIIQSGSDMSIIMKSSNP